MSTKVVPKNSGRFGKGNPGKPKGATTHISREIKDMVIGALADAGGRAYLTRCANDPKLAGAFLSLVGKVLPLQVTGSEGGALVVQLRGDDEDV